MGGRRCRRHVRQQGKPMKANRRPGSPCPCAPGGILRKSRRRTRAEGLLLRQTVFVAEAFGERRHVAAYLFIGDLRVDLGGLDVRMPQQAADGFDRHTLRERDGCGEGMPRHVESDRLCKKKHAGEV